MAESSNASEVPATGHVENSLKIVWVLAWPAVALNSLQTLNALLDTFFISNVSRQAMTAAGAAMPFIFLFFSITFAIGIAATAIVSRAFGAGVIAECITANRKCLSLATYLGFALFLIAWPASFGAAHALIPKGDVASRVLFIEYASIYMLSLPSVFIIQSLAGSLRGIGDTRSPMVISGIQIFLHIALNFLLILPEREVFGITVPGADLGLKGAAIGMAVSSLCAAVTYIAWSKRTQLKSRFTMAWPGMEWIRRIVRIAAPASMMAFFRVSSLMAFAFILRSLPNKDDAAIAVAAIRPGFSIESFAFMPAFGLSIAAATLVGQSLGMKRPDRAAKLGWVAAHQAGIVSLTISVLLFIFASPLAHFIIGAQQDVADVTANFIRFVASTEVFFAYGMVMMRAMQGAGDTRRPMWLSVFALWGVRVPLAAVLALPSITIFGFITIHGANMGANGAWLSMAVTQLIQGVVAVILWKKGAWKSQEV
ncbi:MAG: MATE family efflux transporter [Armatimonadetes bacterium]|nr:MATE family efflux transporter [Armatimonadota bacterium]